MKTFVQWAEENKLELPALSECGRRTGIKPGYPEGYARSQLPELGFMSKSATAALDFENSKKTKEVAG